MEFLFLWLVFGGVGAAILSRHNEAGSGCLLGLLLGPIGWLVAFVMSNNRDKAAEQKQMAEQTALLEEAVAPAAQGRDERECPFCAEPILRKAKVCKHCGRDVVLET